MWLLKDFVTFNGDDFLRVANDKENVFENMKRMSGNDEWLEVLNLKMQDRRRVNYGMP